MEISILDGLETYRKRRPVNIRFPFLRHVRASIHCFLGRHLFYIINFRKIFSYVYFLIVCTTGVVKTIFKCRKWKSSFKKRHSEIWFMRAIVREVYVCVTFKYQIYILRSPTVISNTYQHNWVVCCFKSPIVSFFLALFKLISIWRKISKQTSFFVSFPIATVFYVT